MPAIDQTVIWRPTGGFNPTQPYNGDAANTIFRGQNMILRGSAGAGVYLENWQGVTAANESSKPAPVALTGTVATSGSTLTGTGTKFTQELIPGQWILVSNDIWGVYAINSDTELIISDTFASIASGLTAYKTQIITEVDNLRGNLIRGSIIRFPNGDFLTVGDGDVRFNGSLLTSNVAATKRLTLGQFDPASSTNVANGYTSLPLGMAVPTLTTLTAVGGGTKNMQAGVYSVRIAPARISTGGYNNPSEKVEVTLTAGQQIQITFPAMDTASGQDAWDVYVTLYSTGGGIQGPWYFYGQITTSQVSSAGGNYTIEYNDSEVSGNRLLTFNNDPPPDAVFVATLQGLPVLVSCNGKGRKLTSASGGVATVATNGTSTVTGTSTQFTVDLNRGQLIYIDGKLYTVDTITSDTVIDVSPTPTATASGLDISLADTAPGPVLRPAKPAINGANVEAFPAEFKVAVDPPENIIASIRGAQGRIFVGTENYIHLASSTGNPDLPVTVRPYWRTGIRNPQAMIFVNDTLYAYTKNGATRSIGNADESIEEHSFAAPVAAVMANWTPARVRIGYDPKNEAVCFFHSTAGSGTGARSTECLMYMLRLGIWSPTIIIESATADRIVTGVATISGNLIITISGRSSLPAGALTADNYSWDTGTDAIAAYIATSFMDAGDPGTDKTITGLQMTGYSAAPAGAGVWKSSAGGDVPLVALQNGTSPDSGSVTFTQGSLSRTSFLKRINVPRARLFAVRVALDWLGTGTLARLDELVIRGNVTENRY